MRHLNFLDFLLFPVYALVVVGGQLAGGVFKTLLFILKLLMKLEKFSGDRVCLVISSARSFVSDEKQSD